jgi:hypothetical protein
MVKRGDMLHIFWSSRGTPTTFRWPLLWAIGCGFAIQTIWGLFPVMLCFVLLAGADEGRCPLAAPLRPFFGFVAGAVSAALTFKWCLPRLHTVRPLSVLAQADRVTCNRLGVHCCTISARA